MNTTREIYIKGVEGDAVAAMKQRFGQFAQIDMSENATSMQPLNGEVPASDCFSIEIEPGGVGEWLKPAVLKTRIAIRYLPENSTKSLCQVSDSAISSFFGVR